MFNSKTRGDYTDKQLELMTLIAPHIANHLGVLLDFEAQANDTSPILSAQEIKIFFGLTKRESEIVSLLSMGTEDKEVIQTLCISSSTFKKHLYNAYRKIGVSSRTQLFNSLTSVKNTRLN